jgi:hypothetical protein
MLRKLGMNAIDAAAQSAAAAAAGGGVALAAAAIARFAQFREALGAAYDGAAAPMPSACLVTSLHDEPERERLVEYLACIAANLGVFGRIVVLYECGSGIAGAGLRSIAAQTGLAPERVRIEVVERRPTIGALCAVGATLAPGTMTVVANADIVFDATLARLQSIDLSGCIGVLSRRDVAGPRELPRLIRMPSGLPNIFSADAWIFAAPLEPDFFLDYEIGSFRCDSYINFQISTSRRYAPINPCLEVNAFHLHDPRFNSSETKKGRDAAAIEAQRNRERERNGGVDPMRGIEWSTLEGAARLAPADRVHRWKRKALVVHAATGRDAIAQALLMSVLAPAIAAKMKDVTCLLALDDRDGDFAALLEEYRSRRGGGGFMIDAGAVAPDAQDASRHDVMLRTAETDALVQHLAQGTPARLLAWPDVQGLKVLRCDVTGALSPGAVTQLRALLHGTPQLAAMRELCDSAPQTAATAWLDEVLRDAG